MEDSGWKITEEDVSPSRQKAGGVIFVNILSSLRLGTRVGSGPNGRRGVWQRHQKEQQRTVYMEEAGDWTYWPLVQ